MFKLSAAALAFWATASAVEIRVASYNVGARYTDSGPIHGLGDPGTPGYEATKGVLARIDADVVALQEIHNVDLDDEISGTAEDVAVLAAALGYSHTYFPPRTSLDFTFRVIILSRYPIVTPTSIGSPSPANEITRRFPAVKINVPGTDKDPLIISGHLKSGTTGADKFRRAIEMRRLNDYLVTNQIGADDNFIIMGDFNLSSTNRTFTAAPTDLPGSYVLGTDVTYPVNYSTNPVSYFSPTVPTKLNLLQTNGSNATFQSGSSIDLMLVSPAFAGRPVSSEIYNSELDTSNSVGLPKAGSPLPADTSSISSDHFAIFADLELDADSPNLDLAVNPASVFEKSPPGTAKLTVTIPSPRASNLTVNLASDTPGVARLLSPNIVIPAGALSATVDVETIPNFIDDNGINVGFTGTAPNYDPDTTFLQVANAEGSYIFTTVNQTILEDFTAFDGTHAPAPWSAPDDIPWLGVESGALPTPGFRTYGAPSDPSIGFLPDSADATPVSFQATFSNQSLQTLEALSITFTARQWRAAFNGTADQLKAVIVTSKGTYPVRNLTFTPATHLPNGPQSPPPETSVTATVDGLSVPPGENFDLRFTATPGSGGGSLSTDVFVNEFHYDNNEVDDTGEFIEIVVAPGFSGNLADIRVFLYNGENATAAASYGSHSLDTFTVGTVTSSGHRLFYKTFPTNGIQNGARDGFAVTHGTDVLHFISYEGTMTATSGFAAGLTSTATTLSQSTPQAPGIHSLRLTGTGSSASNFTWAKTNIPHSPGAVNEGQTFTSPTQSQGFSVDNIAVTFLPPDIDSDGDGFKNRIEQNLLLTDPADPGSKFSPTNSQPSPTVAQLKFPTLTGRKYLIQTSTDLIDWDDGDTYSGTGALRSIDFPIIPSEPKVFYRVVVTYE